MTTAKKAAAKKTAATPATSEDTKAPVDTEATTDADGNDTAQDGSEQAGPTAATSFAPEFGPGTSNPDAPAEDSVRPPATIVNADPAAAPLDPPADSHTQSAPERGHDWSSTDHTYAAAGGRTIAGENHYRLHDEDGNTIAPDDLFDDSDPIKTYVVVKQRVLEEFTYPNTTTPVTRIVFAKGAYVPRFEAERIKAAAKADYEAAQAAEQSTPAE